MCVCVCVCVCVCLISSLLCLPPLPGEDILFLVPSSSSASYASSASSSSGRASIEFCKMPPDFVCKCLGHVVSLTRQGQRESDDGSKRVR